MSATPSLNIWQPSLEGSLIRLRPLTPADFEPLYAVGSDPAIWALHPERDRYSRDKFTRYFQSGIESGGALAVLDRNTGRIIGSSRFTGHDVAKSVVEIGSTFLTRDCWGKGQNTELKRLMLAHAFKAVDRVHFHVGEVNLRSRRAVEKLGATLLRSEARTPLHGDSYTSVIYEIAKEAWQRQNVSMFPSVERFDQRRSNSSQTLRIVVVGTSGSGKSTLAKQIAAALEVPHIELDELYWEPNWTEAAPAVFRSRLEMALAPPSWVVDGNYTSVRDFVWPKANTIVWLDYPFQLVFWRSFSRTVRRALLREKLWAGNKESLRRSFLSKESVLVWVFKSYPRWKKQYPELFARPEHIHLKVIHCKVPADADKYVRELRD